MYLKYNKLDISYRYCLALIKYLIYTNSLFAWEAVGVQVSHNNIWELSCFKTEKQN